MVRSATLGKLFNTTKYGSATFDKKLDHHKIIAIAIPKVVPTKNPTTVSYTEYPSPPGISLLLSIEYVGASNFSSFSLL